MRFEEKWDNAAFTAEKFVQVPLALLNHAAALEISPSEAWLLVVIMSYKHTASNPYPSQERLASMLGMSVDTVQRFIKSLRQKSAIATKHVKSHKNAHSYLEYDFSPLVQLLNQHSEASRFDKNPVAHQQSNRISGANEPTRGNDANIRDNAARDTAERCIQTPHTCGTNKRIKKEKKENKREYSNSLPGAQRSINQRGVATFRSALEEAIGKRQFDAKFKPHGCRNNIETPQS